MGRTKSRISRIIQGFGNHIKNKIGIGLIIIFPFGAIWVISGFVVSFVGKIFSPLISSVTNEKISVPGGFILAMLILYLTGLAVDRLIKYDRGEKLINSLETIPSHIPIIKNIYFVVKDFLDIFKKHPEGIDKNRVVRVRFAPEIFLYCVHMGSVMADEEEEIRCYYPTSPMPYSGWTFATPRKNVREVLLPPACNFMAFPELIKHVFSMGATSPEEIKTRALGTTTEAIRLKKYRERRKKRQNKSR